MNWYQTIGLVLTLEIASCSKRNELASQSPRRQEEVEHSLPRETIDECVISFLGYTGMCKRETFGGQTVLLKEYDNGWFDFFLDEDNDNCFDKKGRGFYMDGISRRTDVDNLEPKEYCLK